MFTSLMPLAEDPPTLDYASTAFMLIMAALVLLMTTPGLALFYGGLTRGKSVLNMMMMSFGAFGAVGIVYVLWGYSMSFGPTDVLGIFANPFDKFGLHGADGIINPFGYQGYGNIPELAFVGFQFTFAAITVALISGAVADRVKFSTWMVFSVLWVTLSYFPVAHMVWGGGLLSGAEKSLSSLIFGSTDGAANVTPIDFAGGTVVHINAGMAGLVLAIIVGKRLGFGRIAMRPHNVPVVMIGAGLLWFGWFGFNVGSELAPDETAALVWINTAVATCAAMLGWMLVEKLKDGKATSIGAASGVVAGLVAITPACGALGQPEVPVRLRRQPRRRRCPPRLRSLGHHRRGPARDERWAPLRRRHQADDHPDRDRSVVRRLVRCHDAHHRARPQGDDGLADQRRRRDRRHRPDRARRDRL
jgi:Amt family ammonium transporter